MTRRLHIDRLDLRVGARNAAEARRLGEAVAAALATVPPQIRGTRRVSSLEIRVAAGEATPEGIAAAIARRVREGLR